MVDSSTWFCFASLRWYWWDSTRFLMRTWSSVVENGLVRKSLAPAESAASLVSSSARAVSRTMGMFCVGGVLADFAAGLQAVLLRHHHVQQDDVRQEWPAFSTACWPSTASSTLVMRCSTETSGSAACPARRPRPGMWAVARCAPFRPAGAHPAAGSARETVRRGDTDSRAIPRK